MVRPALAPALAVALALALALLAACGGARPAPPPPTNTAPASPAPSRASSNDSTEAAIVMLGEFRDQMCGCKDEACAEKTDRDMAARAEEMRKTAGDTPPKLTPEQEKRAMQIVTALMDCRQKLVLPLGMP